MNCTGWLTARLLAGLLFLSCVASSAEVQVVHPQRVVDLQEVIAKRYNRPDLSAVGITEANGRWAVLMHSGARDGVVVKGDWNSERASLHCGSFDEITMDAEHRVYLRHRSTAEGTRVTVIPWETSDSSVVEIPSRSARPLLADGKIRWWGAQGRAGYLSPGPAGRLQWTESRRLPDQPRVPNPIGEIVRSMGLPGGARLELGSRTEVARVFNPDGSIRSVAVVDLDAAYALIGRAYPKPELASGMARMLWASSSSDGLLYVCLTGVPLAQGAHIAVIQPANGQLLKVIRAILPGTKWRRGPYNPDGAIFPSRGAAYDRFVILDRSLDMVAIY